jgi:hypothetical protein
VGTFAFHAAMTASPDLFVYGQLAQFALIAIAQAIVLATEARAPGLAFAPLALAGMYLPNLAWGRLESVLIDEAPSGVAGVLTSSAASGAFEGVVNGLLAGALLAILLSKKPATAA